MAVPQTKERPERRAPPWPPLTHSNGLVSEQVPNLSQPVKEGKRCVQMLRKPRDQRCWQCPLTPGAQRAEEEDSLCPPPVDLTQALPQYTLLSFCKGLPGRRCHHHTGGCHLEIAWSLGNPSQRQPHPGLGATPGASSQMPTCSPMPHLPRGRCGFIKPKKE